MSTSPPDKKQKTDENVIWPTIEGVDKPVLQTLATVCAKLYDEALFAAWKPTDGKPIDDQLAQAYELSKSGGEYKKGGKYYTGKDGKPAYTNGTGDVVKGFDVFNHSTKAGEYESLAQYGTVIDGFTDFHREDQAAIPPFAALIVQPNDEGGKKEAPILILAWRGSKTVIDWISDAAFSPTLSSRWSGNTKEINAHGAFTNLVENTFSQHEDAIVDLLVKYPEVERAFITGHSLGGGIANVAHLVVRAQLALAQAGLLGRDSAWAKLYKLGNKVKWLSCTFASPMAIVRKYVAEDKKPPPLIVELDESSYNIVYGCDPFSRTPGMLKFLGDCVEVVVPKVGEETVGTIGWHTIVIPFLDAQLRSLHGVKEATHDAVKFLKNKGLTEVMGQFTHLGTVVYLAAEGLNPPEKGAEYVYPKGEDAIQEVLNVEGPDFLKLWGGAKGLDKCVESVKKAHGASYERLMYK